jgi:hypothetical protein
MNRAFIRTGLLNALLFVILLYLFSCRQGESGLDDDGPAGDNNTGLQTITVTPVPGFAIEGGIPQCIF